AAVLRRRRRRGCIGNRRVGRRGSRSVASRAARGRERLRRSDRRLLRRRLQLMHEWRSHTADIELRVLAPSENGVLADAADAFGPNETATSGTRGSSSMSEPRRIDDTLYELPADTREDMRVPARVFADEEILSAIRADRSLEQLQNVATLPGIVDAAIAMPDIH